MLSGLTADGLIGGKGKDEDMAGMVGVVDSLDNTETEEDTETFKADGKASDGDGTTTGQDAWKSN